MAGDTFHITASGNSLVNIGHSFAADKKRVELLNFLLPHAQSKESLVLQWDHQQAKQKRVGKTGQWFLGSDQFQSWLLEPNSFLWLHGIAGCGKTVLRYER